MQINSATITYEDNQIYTPKTSGLLNIKTRLEDIINNLISKEELDLQSQINEKFKNLDFDYEFDIDAQKISADDAAFFIGILNENSVVDYTINDDGITLSLNDKQIKTTKSLLNMLQTSYDSKKPIRLDFDKDITVILKLDRHGKIQAHFIPGSNAVEEYLKQNIPSLKEIFDKENINYSYLGYSQNKNENSKRQKRSQQ